MCPMQGMMRDRQCMVMMMMMMMMTDNDNNDDDNRDDGYDEFKKLVIEYVT